MMKGKFAVAAFAALLGVSSTAIADNKDGDGKIEFFGNIIDAGCQIDTEASNLSVKLKQPLLRRGILRQRRNLL